LQRRLHRPQGEDVGVVAIDPTTNAVCQDAGSRRRAVLWREAIDEVMLLREERLSNKKLLTVALFVWR